MIQKKQKKFLEIKSLNTGEKLFKIFTIIVSSSIIVVNHCVSM